MRIAQVAPPAGRTASGILTVLADLSTALVRRGHDVELWYHGEWTAPNLRALRTELQRAGVPSRQLPVERRRWKLLPDIGLHEMPPVDVVHAHSVFVPDNTALARLWGGPLVLSPHGGYHPASLRRSANRKRVYAALFEKSMVRRAAVTVALTTTEALQVTEFAPGAVTAVVPNGVKVADTGRSTSAPLRDRLHLSSGDRLALFVGRLDIEHKGLDRLLAATAVAPSWHVALVGPDHRGGVNLLRATAARHGVSSRCHLMGPMDGGDLAAAYSSADVFVLPSRWEGLPMSLLEALAHGVPALVSSEVDRLVPVRERGAGWSAGPADLGTTMESLAALDDDEWHDRSRAARLLAGDYNWDHVAAAYEKVYAAAVRRHRSSRAQAVADTAPR